MKMRKTNLDEQQERRLLELESRGFWLAFWGSLTVLLVQILMMADVRAIVCQWILFMGLALYLGIACARAGIWDRRLDMSRKTCVLVALIGALCAAAFLFVFSYLRFQRLSGSLAAAVITGPITFVLTYLLLRLTARATKKRQDALNAEPEDEEKEKDEP